MTQIGSGVLDGGWTYVWSAYIVAWVGIVVYSGSLWLRLRGIKNTGKDGAT